MGARRGTWKEGFFTEDPEEYLKEHFIAPVGGDEVLGGGGYLTGNFERKPILFYRDKLDCWRL